MRKDIWMGFLIVVASPLLMVTSPVQIIPNAHMDGVLNQAT